MKKIPVILAFSLILTFTSILFTVEGIKNSLPEPQIGSISNWSFDKKNCTYNKTIIKATLEITNPPNDIAIDLIKTKTKFDIKYDNLKLGNLTFIHPDNLNTAKKEERISIKPDVTIELPLFFSLNNTNVSKALWNHINVNHEKGNITFEFKLLFALNVPLIQDYLDKITNDLQFIIPLQTDMLNSIDELIYQSEWKKTIPFTLQHTIFKNIFNIEIYKQPNSTLSTLNFTSLRINKPLIDIYLGEPLSWQITCKQNCAQASKNFIITWNWWKEKIVKFVVLNGDDDFAIYANDHKMGNITLKCIDERKIGIMLNKYKISTYNMLIELNFLNLNKILYCHILFDEVTYFSVPDLNVSIPIAIKISDILGDVSPIDVIIQWTNVKNLLSHIQSISLGGIIGISLLMFYIHIWRNYFRKQSK